MANIPSGNPYNPYIIKDFYGLWIQSETGNARLPVGYSGNMTNFYITKSKKLKKAEGYKRIFESVTNEIREMWQGLIKGVETTIFVAGGNVYKLDMTEYTHTIIGTITDDITNIFGFDDIAYIINGNEYKYYDGTTFGDVIDISYVPKTFVAQTPDRSESTPFERINLLNGKRTETYLGDGTSTQYYVGEQNIDSILEVKVNGVITTDFETDLAGGHITFNTAPSLATAGDNVEITYKKGYGSPAEIYKNKYFCIYGGDNDTRVFLYGNEDAKHTVQYSDLADGIPKATYFPANNFISVGSENTPVMDMVVLNTRFIIYKSEQAYIGYYYFSTDVGIVEYPTKPLSKVKTEVFNQVQVCDAIPYSIGGDEINILESTYVRDERNLRGISGRIQKDLENIDLSKSLAYDWEDRKWFMVFNNKWVWIYDYEIDAFSRLYINHEVTSVLEIDKKLYFGTKDGFIMKVDIDERSFDGETFASRWESGMMDFERPEIKKNLRYMYLTLFPKNKSQIKVSLKTTPKSPTTVRELIYNNLDFGDIDFSDFSFTTNYDPTPFLIRIKAKKFSFLQVVLENDEQKDAIVLGLRLPVTFAGKFK